MTRALGLDHGEARCGVAVSDPTGELVTPLDVVERPDTRRGLAALADLIRDRGAERVIVGLPLTLAGEEGGQAQAARGFAERLSELLDDKVRRTQLGQNGATISRSEYDWKRIAETLATWMAEMAV